MQTFVLLILVLLPWVSGSGECGKVKVYDRVKSSLVIGEEIDTAYAGQFPWFVSLLHNRKGYQQFFCGSSLISPSHLLSAAHCFLYDSSNYYAFLGRHDLSDVNEKNWVNRTIAEIHTHPSYNFSRELYGSTGDIAVLKMRTPVDFTDFIQPVCLPSANTASANLKGIVVGYGSVVGHEDTLKFAEMDTIDVVKCIFKNASYAKIVSEFSFCANNPKAAPCTGDSGGGFFKWNSQSQHFEVIGIVSHALKPFCNYEDFSAFVEVSKYLDWIAQHISYERISIDCGKNSAFDEKKGTCECDEGYDLDFDFFNSVPGCKHFIHGFVGTRDINFLGIISYKNLQAFEPAESTEISSDDFKISTEHQREEVKALYIQERGAKVKFLPGKVSESFPNLVLVVAERNQIKRLTKANFEKLKKIELLSLGRNAIESIEANAFEDLSALRFCFLWGNKLKTLSPKLFRNNPNIEILQLNQNQLTTLTAEHFKHLTVLRHLTLNENELTSLDPNIFANLGKIEVFWLGNNQLSTLLPHHFRTLTSLKELDLSNNSISRIDVNLFSTLTRLKNISLNYNKFSTLPDDVFKNNRQLEEIWLNNNISKFNPTLFDNMPNLKRVDLEENQCIDKIYYNEQGLTKNEKDQLKNDLRANCS